MNEAIKRPGKAFSFVTACFLLGAIAGWLLSCSSPQGGVGNGSGSETHVFPINVLLYRQPVEVAAWKPDPARADNSEGAALNVVTAMQRGDIDAWLNCWAADERPQLTSEERQRLLDEWAPLKSGRIRIVGRVVAATDMIEQVSVQGGQKDQTLQIPLKHHQGHWLLTKLDPDDEYLHWQDSPKKVVEQLDPAALRKYLSGAKSGVK